MIDVDELERLAKVAVGDETIEVHRNDLILLINRYRELPDLTIEEQSEVGEIPGVNLEPGREAVQHVRSRSSICRCN